VNQSYIIDPGVPGTTSNDHVIPGRPATVTEKIVLDLDARDVSASPGDQVNKFKESLANLDYFQTILNKTNGVQLASLSPLQTGPDGKAFELFTLECVLPEQTR
jgi:hypothetical protein